MQITHKLRYAQESIEDKEQDLDQSNLSHHRLICSSNSLISPISVKISEEGKEEVRSIEMNEMTYDCLLTNISKTFAINRDQIDKIIKDKQTLIMNDEDVDRLTSNTPISFTIQSNA